MIELFTTPDADAVDRTLEYIGRFRREVRHGPYGHDRYLFAAVLLFLTGTQVETGLDMVLPGQKDVFVRLGLRPMVLAEQDAVVLLDEIEHNKRPRSLLIWVPLMKGGQNSKIVARWRKLLEREKDEARRKTIVDLARVFADLAGCQEVWDKGLEGVDVNESKVMREVRQQGAVVSKREDLLEFLEARYSGQLPATFLERLRTEADLGVLSRWVRLAGSASSLDAFLAALDR